MLFAEIDRVITRCGVTTGQQDTWQELVQQNRIKPYAELVTDLLLS